MGKPPGQLPEPTTIQHFSHQHPLQLTNHQSHLALFPVTCSCCKQQASGWIYTCNLCKYFLHVSCSQLPQRITHPFDHQSHVLSLLPTPAYPEGSFDCDACGKKGSDGFSYHCGACSIDLHTYCASMPMTITHQSHHYHQLNLIFSAPYPCQSFSCDLCGTLGSKQWLYRCNLCGFDVHLDCAKIEQGERVPDPVQAPDHHPPHHNQVQAQVQAPPPVLLQPVQVQQYQAFPTPAVPVYRFSGNPMAIRPAPAMAAPQPFHQVPNYTPNSYMINPAAPPNAAAYGSNTNMGGRGSQQGNSLSDQFLLSVIDGVGQTLDRKWCKESKDSGYSDGGGCCVGDGGGGGGGSEADFGAHGDQLGGGEADFGGHGD